MLPDWRMMTQSERCPQELLHTGRHCPCPALQAAQEAGFNVLFGDGSRKKVLHAAGVERPKAIAVGYTARQRAVTAVEALHEAYPGVPIYVRALDLQHAAALKEAGEP